MPSVIEQVEKYVIPFSRIGINKLDGQILGMFIHAVDEVIRILQENEIPHEDAFKLLTYNHIFANMVAVTPYKTTDRWLDGSILKRMFLYTAYNTRFQNTRTFFDYDSKLASLWFAQYSLPVIGCVSESIQANMIRHFSTMDERCIFLPQSTHAFFWSDYFYPSIAKTVKRRFNRSIVPSEIINKPNYKKIAIVTGNWKPTHAVTRSVGQIVYALAGKYDLTLVHLGPIDSRADVSIFECVKQVCMKGGMPDCSEIEMNDFGVAIFLDIGLTPESIYLSNSRLAPIQIACLGHPASGRGNKIDYFLTGENIDLLGEYSETPIFVPGSGVLPRLPEYSRDYVTLGDRKRVAVPWSAIKYNMLMFKHLKRLQAVGAHLVFFPGNPIHKYQASIPVRMAMLDYFGPDITIMPNLLYADYMRALESCHFALDSYPFGGYNTVVESLWCGRPVVALEGRQWFNRAASYLLHRADMSELVTHSYEGYLQIAKRLITDEKFYQAMVRRVNNVDFRHLVGSDDSENFVLAIDHVISKQG